MLILVVILSFAALGRGEQITGHIKYVSKSAVYIDLGRAAGIQVSDVAAVLRDGAQIAGLEVTYISEATSACRVLQSSADIRVGDLAVLEIKQAQASADTSQIAPARPVLPVAISDADLIGRTRARRGSRFTGRAELQYYGQFGRENGAGDFAEPSLALSGRAQRMAGSGLTLNWRARARQVSRNSGGLTSNQWNSRIYELALSYDSPNEQWHYKFGRVLPENVGGLGYLDGLTISRLWNDHWRTGLFTGTEPNPVTSRPDVRVTKAGGFVKMEAPGISGLNSTMALVGVYRRGVIDKEYCYIQNSLAPASGLSLYQSADIQINRNWRREAAGTPFSLSSLIASLRYRLSSGVGLGLGYDQWDRYRTADDRNIADSLWDASSRQGFNAQADFRLPLEMNGYLSGRIGSGGGSHTRAASGGIGWYDRRFTALRLRLGGSAFEALYSRGHQVTASASRELFGVASCGMEYGSTSMKMKQGGATLTGGRWRISVDARITRAVYAAASYELERGDEPDADRVFVDLGVRL